VLLRRLRPWTVRSYFHLSVGALGPRLHRRESKYQTHPAREPTTRGTPRSVAGIWTPLGSQRSKRGTTIPIPLARPVTTCNIEGKNAHAIHRTSLMAMQISIVLSSDMEILASLEHRGSVFGCIHCGRVS
jgi:hypothetical protein